MHADSSHPRLRLALYLLAAGSGLGLFFAGAYRDLPLGWIGTVLFIAAVWYAYAVVRDGPRNESELEVPAAEWQAWLGTVFLAVVLALLLQGLPQFNQPLPISRNPDLRGVSFPVGACFVAWALLAHALRTRWRAHAQEDEFDLRIQQRAQSWGSRAAGLLIVGVAVTLGFNEPTWVAQYHPAFWAQLLMLPLLIGALVQNLGVALLYARERRASVAP